jgi:hypothetical protein
MAILNTDMSHRHNENKLEAEDVVSAQGEWHDGSHPSAQLRGALALVLQPYDVT